MDVETAHFFLTAEDLKAWNFLRVGESKTRIPQLKEVKEKKEPVNWPSERLLISAHERGLVCAV